MNWYKKSLTSESTFVIVSQMKKEFIIMRGLPGSGKSTLARELAGETGQQFATDDFFVDKEGNYKWDERRIGYAHDWNKERIKRAIEQGVSPVIMDNTNVSKWELRSLGHIVDYAESQGYEVRIEEVDTPWAFDAKELAKRNSHGVPQGIIENFIRRWHPNPTVEDIKNDFQPPEMR